MSRRRQPKDSTPWPRTIDITCTGKAKHPLVTVARAEIWEDGAVSFDQFGPEVVFVDVDGYSGDPTGLQPHMTRPLVCNMCRRNVPLTAVNEERVFKLLASGGVSSIELARLAAIV